MRKFSPKRICSAILALVFSAGFFVGCTDNSTDNPPPSGGEDPVIELTIDGEKEKQIYFGDELQLTATTNSTDSVKWMIEGNNLGASVTAGGLLTAGETEGSVVVKAYLENDSSISDTCSVTIVEPMLASATALGTSHNNIIQLRSFTYTFRTYFQLREYGEFEYSFYYDNKLDTTWWSVANATANTNGSKFTILSAYFADGGTEPDGAVVEGTSKAITFDAQTSKSVGEGEEFRSDSVTMNIPEGHFLAFTWTIKVAVAEGPSVPFTESSFATCFKKNGDYASQESKEGFVTGNATFGDNVLVAPNKIEYKRPKGKNLVFVGDSITQGVATQRDEYEFWVAQVANGLPASYSVWNLGSGWATAGNLASDGAWLKKAATADELFVCLGVNDLGSNPTLAEYQQLINTIVSAVKEKNPDCVITLFTVPPFGYTGNQGNTWFEMNDWIREHNVANVDRYFDFAAVLSQPYPNENHLKSEYWSSTTDCHPNGLAGEAVAESFLSWYNGDADSAIKEVYDNYVNVDYAESFSLPEKVLVKCEDGFYDYREVAWNTAATTDTVGITTYTGSFADSALQVKYTVRVRKTTTENASDTLYFVNCGNELENDGGYLNSTYDQAYGTDSVSQKSWGYDPSVPTARYWEDNSDEWLAIRCSNGSSDILYKFELDAGSYMITFGFKDPWNVQRTMRVTADDVVLDEDMSNGGGAQTSHSCGFTVSESKVVDIRLSELTGQGAAINWISINRAESKPADNDIIGAVGGDGYVKLEWNYFLLAEEYEVFCGTESGVYDDAPIVTTRDRSAFITDLTNGTAYYFVVRAKNANGVSDYSNEVCVTPQPRTDENVVYNIDCGTVGIIPLGNELGTHQSVEDQAYGKDEVTGYSWGYVADGGEWNSGNPNYENSVLVANLNYAGGYEGYGIHYTFGLENGEYEVQLVFYDYWKNDNRITDVILNGETVMEGYVSACGAPETYTFKVTVTDGVILLDVVGGAGNADNVMIAGIKITKI